LDTAVKKGPSPGELIVARCNHAFFAVAVVSELLAGTFEDVAYAGQRDPAKREFSHQGYHAVMRVDTTGLGREESFMTKFQKAVSNVAHRLPAAVEGDLNDRAQIGEDEYCFEFRITGYWSMTDPDRCIVRDPKDFPTGENLGRELQLRISYDV
jgi:hypothetical protein